VEWTSFKELEFNEDLLYMKIGVLEKNIGAPKLGGPTLATTASVGLVNKI